MTPQSRSFEPATMDPLIRQAHTSLARALIALVSFSALADGWLPGPRAAYAGDTEVDTLQTAETVLEKGLGSVDLGKYPGVLLLHAMSELAISHPEYRQELLRKSIELFRKYHIGEIEGRGSFICYGAGGSGAALLRYRGLADVLAEQVDSAALGMVKEQKRSIEGLLIPPWTTERQVFIDMAFGVTPFLLYAGLSQDRLDLVDLAVEQTVGLFRILRDTQTGLLHQGRGFHGEDVVSQDNWSRGNGWGAFALAILVRDLPEKHPRRQEVERLAKSFFFAVIQHQDECGLWHQEMTDESSYVETSGSGLLLYGLGIMIEAGLLAPRHKEDIERGIRGYLAYIDRDGSVSHTCTGCLCPGNGTKEDYRKHEWAVNDPHAFGPVVLAFTQAFRLGIAGVEPPAERAHHPNAGEGDKR